LSWGRQTNPKGPQSEPTIADTPCDSLTPTGALGPPLRLRKVDGWPTLSESPSSQIDNRAAWSDSLKTAGATFIADGARLKVAQEK
jgi:hypothetical protein